MSLRILLTGKNGQIGHDLNALLPSLGEVHALDRQQLDLANADAIRRIMQDVRPNLVVNAAAYTAVDKAESEEAAAHAINALAPGVLAGEAAKCGAALIHYSTDYVFDGLKNEPYDETDAVNPQNVYGRSKLAGEKAIRETGVPHLILRTAWVYATRGRNFLLTILRLATERDELTIVRDQIGAPTWCHEIARATAEIIASLPSSGDPSSALAKVGGTYHLTAAGAASWYDFARAIVDEYRDASPDLPWLAPATAGRQLKLKSIFPITTDQYPAPARRPPYSVLSNARLHRTFGMELPHWREQLHSAFRK